MKFFYGALFVILIGGATILAIRHRVVKTVPPILSTTLKVTINSDITNEQRSRITSALKAASVSYTLTTENPDLTFGTKIGTNTQTLESVAQGNPVKLTNATLVQPTNVPAVTLSGQNTELVSSIVTHYLPIEPAPTWTVNALGDVIIGRTVYQIENQANDYTSSFSKMAALTKNADLTVANLESVLSDNVEHPTLGMTFSAPTRAADGLVSAGIDAVNLANNHAYNYGDTGFRDTMAALDTRKIGYFGGGINATTAHSPLIVTVKGKKIALLGYSSIIGSYEAQPNKSGQAWLSMAPWGPFDEQRAQAMEADIKAAKQQTDLVFVYYHWGTEYTHDAGADQRTIAHRAVDAGADVILGTHPHWVQGVEWYKNKLITYSLGNFVFDQEWSTETKQGTFLSMTFNGNTLIGASLTPYEIENYNRPEPVNVVKGNKILQDVYQHSWWAL